MSGAQATAGNIKITETGTVDLANLGNPKMYYESASSCVYDGNESNAAGTVSGQTVTFNLGAAPVPPPANFLCLYLVFDLDGANTKGGQTIHFMIANPAADIALGGGRNTAAAAVDLAGVTTVIPKITATTFGSGLADGGRSGDSITISGYGFGTASGGRADCAGGVDTGCVKFSFGGGATVAGADISTWSNTAVTFTIAPDLATFGGPAAMKIISGSQSPAAALDFLVYPRITGMITCPAGGDRDRACGTNASPEYNAADAHGLVQLNGDHFGAVQGNIEFTGGFGSLGGVVHGSAQGACGAPGWGPGSVCVEVSPSIGDDVYDGKITLVRDADSKTDNIDLHILPRILLSDPASGMTGDIVAVNGNHFCSSGACPAAPPTGAAIVYFGSTALLAGDFSIACSGGSKWSDTQICVKVPAAAVVGSQNIKIQSRAFPVEESQRQDFTVISSAPGLPANLQQFKSDGVTAIPADGNTNEKTVKLAADLSAPTSIGMIVQIEIKNSGVPFDATGIIDGAGCSNCSAFAGAAADIGDLADGSYHWRARAKNRATLETSDWVEFNSGNAAFAVDASAPAISDISSGTPESNAAAIAWNTLLEQSTSQVQYNKTGIFVDDCAVNNDCTTIDSGLVFGHSVSLANLDSDTAYYYRVRSKDALSNESVSAVNNFITQRVNQPSKTTVFYITGEQATVSGPADSYFGVFAPENSISVKSAFIEITGIVSGAGDNITFQANNVAAKTYRVSAGAPTHFKFVYEITDPGQEPNLNFNDIDPCTNGAANSQPPFASAPPCNRLTVTPGPDISIDAYSAKIFVTYSYTP